MSLSAGAHSVVWVLWAVDATVATVLARRFLADWRTPGEDRAVLVTLGAIIVGVVVALSAGIAILQFGVLS
jgi:hypothetical protein